MIFGFIKSHRNKRIIAAQSDYIKRLYTEPGFAISEATRKANACLSNWISNPKIDNRVLELGCGPGRYVAMLSMLGFNVVGADPIHYSNWETIKNLPNVEFRDKVMAEELPFTNGNFDQVCCLGALLYFKNPIKAMNEIYRVLKPNGRLLLRTPNSENLFTKYTGKKIDPAANQYYNKSEIINLIQKSGFYIKEYFTFGYFPPCFPNYYWYLQNVCLNNNLQEKLSDYLSEKNRVNHIIYAERI